MSLILDALNKADSERIKDEMPSITSDHDLTIMTPYGITNKKFTLILVFIVVVLSLLVLYLSLAREKTDEPNLLHTQAQRPSSVANQSQFKQALLPNDDARKVPELPKDKTKSLAVKENAQQEAPSTYEVMKKKLIAAQYQQAERELFNKNLDKQTESENTNNNSDVATIYQSTSDKVASNAQGKQSPSPASLAPTLAKKHKTLDDYPTLRFINELSQSIQRTIPTLMYRQHVFDGKSSFITVNNNKRRKGQLVAEKIILEEILSDGIILRFEKNTFKMAALNSWINI